VGMLTTKKPNLSLLPLGFHWFPKGPFFCPVAMGRCDRFFIILPHKAIFCIQSADNILFFIFTKLLTFCYWYVILNTSKEREVKQMRHFVFEDYATGEEFIVGAYSLDEAIKEAKMYFADPSYICEYTEEEAEMSGLDEY
jgi:hypothetical protein